MSIVKTNVNLKIKIKLKDKGLRMLAEHNNEIFKDTPMMQKMHRDESYYAAKIDANGWYEMSIWEAMQVFGSGIGMGIDLPFETEVLIETE